MSQIIWNIWFTVHAYFDEFKTSNNVKVDESVARLPPPMPHVLCILMTDAAWLVYGNQTRGIDIRMNYICVLFYSTVHEETGGGRL